MHLRIKLYDMKNSNITFFICSLGSGGAEHKLTTLAHFFWILRIAFAEEDHYPINKNINLDEWAQKIAIFFYEYELHGREVFTEFLGDAKVSTQ